MRFPAILAALTFMLAGCAGSADDSSGPENASGDLGTKEVHGRANFGTTGPSTVSSGTADCGAALRSGGVVYTERGFSKHSASYLGQADDSVCEDIGEDARGAFFPSDPRQVDVWSFEGTVTSEVLGVEERHGVFRIFVSIDVQEPRATQLARML